MSHKRDTVFLYIQGICQSTKKLPDLFTAGESKLVVHWLSSWLSSHYILLSYFCLTSSYLSFTLKSLSLHIRSFDINLFFDPFFSFWSFWSFSANVNNFTFIMWGMKNYYYLHIFWSAFILSEFSFPKNRCLIFCFKYFYFKRFSLLFHWSVPFFLSFTLNLKFTFLRFDDNAFTGSWVYTFFLS